MPGPIGGLVKLVGSGIGLATEAVADRKSKKAAQERQSVSPNPQTESSRGRSTSPYPPEKQHDKDKSGDEDSSSDSDADEDREEWALDDAAAELEPPSYSESALGNVDPMPIDDRVATFMGAHNLGKEVRSKPLPQPVIIPQRRPKDRSRGFVRAYAPVLDECAGIDQQTFLDFLQDFYQASQASPVYNVINVAAAIAGNVPSPIAMGVSIGVQVVNNTAKEVHTRYKYNTYLDRINETLFKPRGLYAMIMTYQPDNPQFPILQIDTSSANNAIYKVASGPSSNLNAKMRNIRLASGKSVGENALPEGAPLVFPALDAVAANADPANPLPAKAQSALKTSFIADYYDRRAQAIYTSSNPNSKLAVPSAAGNQTFASRFSDPNHAANSGTILGLLTGGTFDPKARKRGRKARRRASKLGVSLTQDEVKQAEMGRLPRGHAGAKGGRRNARHGGGDVSKQGPLGGYGPIGLLKRALKKDVLYLLIVNLPSESEMRKYREQLGLGQDSNVGDGGGVRGSRSRSDGGERQTGGGGAGYGVSAEANANPVGISAQSTRLDMGGRSSSPPPPAYDDVKKGW